VSDADFVINNFTPRVMGNLGLGHDVLSRVNPRVSLVSFSGYGASGPYRNFRANAPSIEATSGWASLMGPAGRPAR
jgi:crotonobetainyl-CoA:carnitine CoA-transferase CaiB-like acyl-CoA transferase